MKLGVTLTIDNVGSDPGVIRDYAQGLAHIGIDFVATPEHVVGAHPDQLRGENVHTYDKPYYEPVALFGFIAAAAPTLELVTSILILPQRPTALVAKQLAMVDLLCGGKLRVGVGVGRNWVEYDVLGQDFSNRGRRMEEQISVLRKFWTEELVTFHGDWHQLDQVGINPLPKQRPIPIWMGSFVGGTSERVLKRIGEMADGWFPQAPPGDALSESLVKIHTYALEAGRDPGSIGLECVMNISAADDAETWAITAAAYRALGATHLKANLLLPDGDVAPHDVQLQLLSRWIAATKA
jgi:probable F420-dependent oxidoreductase